MSEKQYANTELAPASEQRKVKLRLSTGCSGVREISIDAAWNAPGRVANEYEKIYKKVLFRRIKPRKVKKKMLSEWIVFLCILGCLVASLTVQKLENLQFWAVETWKWCVLVLAIFRGMFVANLFMHFIVFVIETNLLLRKKVLIYVHKMKKSVEVFMWLGMVLLTWLLLFNSRIERSKTSTKILDYVMWTLVSGLIGAFLWSLKTLLFEIFAIKHKVDTFYFRICKYKNVGNPLLNKTQSCVGSQAHSSEV